MGSAEDKIKMALQRFDSFKATLAKNPRFSSSELIEIGTLIGNSGARLITGVLIEMEPSVYYLQDLYSSVRLDLSLCSPPSGFITVGSVCILSGEYKSERFFVNSFVLPEIQPRSAKNEGRDLFGADSKFQRLYGDLLRLELKGDRRTGKERPIDQQVGLGCLDLRGLRPELKDSSVAVFSGFLFAPDSLKKFETFLKELQEASLPLVFVLLGEFSAIDGLRDSKDFREYCQNLDLFVKTVKRFPKAAKSSVWLFVPAASDLGLPVLPREGLPEYLFERIRKELPLSFNCSNPARAKILGKEMTFLRNDMIKDLRRNAVLPVSQDTEVESAFVQTIVSQGFLSPISQYSQPVFWNYCQSLEIERLPNYLILGDGFCKQFEKKAENCEDAGVVACPGNWGKHGEFLMIYPMLNVIQCCKVN